MLPIVTVFVTMLAITTRVVRLAVTPVVPTGGPQQAALVALEEDLDGTPARLGTGSDRMTRRGARVGRALLGLLGHQSVTREM